MPVLLKLALFGVGFAFALSIWFRLAFRKSCRRAAEKIFRQMAEMFRDEHEYRVTSKSDLPAADETAYAEVEAVLRERGFSLLGSVEDVTVSRVNPAHRIRIDCFAGDDGAIGVSTYSIGGYQITEFCTYYRDGRSLLTNNAVMNKLGPPPAVSRLALPWETPLAAILDRHEQRVAERAEQEPSARILPCAKLHEMLALLRASSRLTSEYRRSIGYLTEEEMRSFTGGPGREAAARIVWQEYRRLRERGRKAA